MTILPLLDDAFLSSHWAREYEAFKASPKEEALLQRLRAWSGREILKETSSEAAFIQRFFVETWGYRIQGVDDSGRYSCRPQFEIANAGQTGGQGSADLALGHFGPEVDGVPQVLCEFKDIRSGLEAPQSRKGNTRSPVDQAFDYLQGAYASRNRDALVTPFWAIVTDMREFRLYARDRGKSQYQRFVLSDATDPRVPALLGDSEAARFRRFVFWSMFQPDLLLAGRGAPALDDLLRDQIVREKLLEKTFYHEYRAYRESVYNAIREANPDFKGTRGKMVRLTQRFLDRCLFVLFCEDMGHTLRYPPELLRDLLIEESNSKFYSPESSACWDHMKRLFLAMRDGGHFGPHVIDKFNGGLFEEDPELEGLSIPTKVFCAARQGAEGGKSLTRHPETLLYFSAAYNFGHRDGSGERVINLYALGRIFEQSITELEIMEAEADERVSINKISKRKTDGVYYTPEWVTFYLVENTVGTRLADIKAELGYAELPPLDDLAIAEYRAYQKDKRKIAKTAGLHRDFLENYRHRLNTLRVVDPACGSGAFLIQALNRLIEEYRWITAEQERLEGQASLFDQDELIRSILSHNIYGVDINPESVEITKLALWLHTAAPGKPLCALDHNIQCGNSLVAPDFYDKDQTELFDENQRERVNVFDWKLAFPEVFDHGGFDCVIGNPPYIKLQHFRKAQAEVADYVSNHYASAGSGNWDMYLPFIEKGVQILHPEGRMGYIAPNVWMVNDYGAALRAWIKQRGALDRWIDFKSFQVFDEAITYTALQFFRGKRSSEIACVFAPDGNIVGMEWEEADKTLYSDLPDQDSWHLVSTEERELLEKITKAGNPLLDSCSAISVGIQTSADNVYHLHRINPGIYETVSGEQIKIEDEMMHPLLSGPEVKRYLKPITNTFILFPYEATPSGVQLITVERLKKSYPLAWNYLCANEEKLKGREGGIFDDPEWYRFGRNQSLNIQEIPKLCVAQTVPSLRVCFDHEGAFYINNVRVNGILPEDNEQGWYLLGILNSPIADYYFKRIAKPKSGGYYEANKQFIAPIPIPDASPEERKGVGDQAKELQHLHSSRRDLIDNLDKRLSSEQAQDLIPKPEPEWIWAKVGTKTSFVKHPDLPKGLDKTQTRAWSKLRHEEALTEQLDTLDAMLQPGAVLRVDNTGDEIALYIDGRRAIALYDKPDTPFIAAQWRHTLRYRNVTEAYNGNKLLKDLLQIKDTKDEGLKSRILNLDSEITALDRVIATKERELNEIVAALYGVDLPK